MVGSLAGYVWQQFLKPLDERATRSRAQQLYAEAELRLQLSLPIAVGIGAIAITWQPDWWQLAAAVIPGLLAVHGWALWQSASRLPLRADLREADLSSAYLRRANCTHIDLTNANLQGADLTEAEMISTRLSGTQLNGADLTRIDLRSTSGLIQGQLRSAGSLAGTNLGDTRISGVNFAGLNLTGANLKGANLVRANLSRANLSRANLTEANLTGTNLTEANLAGTNFTRANLTRVELADADFTGANLTEADFTGVSLTSVNLTRALWNAEPKWPSGYDYNTETSVDWAAGGGYTGFRVIDPRGWVRFAQIAPRDFVVETAFEFVDERTITDYVESLVRDGYEPIEAQIMVKDACTFTAGEHIVGFEPLPRFMAWFEGAYGRHTLAAILHHKLIRKKERDNGALRSDELADGLFRDMMGVAGVPLFKRWLLWAAVVARTRWGAGGMRRLGIMLWTLAALAGISCAIVSFTSLATDLQPVGQTGRWLGIVSVGLPYIAGLLWGRQYGASIIMSAAGLWLFPAAITILAGLAVYSLSERIAGIVYGAGVPQTRTAPVSSAASESVDWSAGLGYTGFRVVDPQGWVRLGQITPRDFVVETTFEFVDERTTTDYVEFLVKTGCEPVEARRRIRNACTFVASEQVTNFESVPRFMAWFERPYGRHALALVLHNNLIRGEPNSGALGSDELADSLFRDMMGVAGVPLFKRWLLWAAVVARTRWAVGSNRRLWFMLWTLAALVGIGCAIVSFTSLVTNLQPLEQNNTSLAVVSVVLPLIAGLLWGKQYGASIVMSAAGLWLFPAAIIILAGLAVYDLSERIAGPAMRPSRAQLAQ